MSTSKSDKATKATKATKVVKLHKASEDNFPMDNSNLPPIENNNLPPVENNNLPPVEKLNSSKKDIKEPPVTSQLNANSDVTAVNAAGQTKTFTARNWDLMGSNDIRAGWALDISEPDEVKKLRK